MPTPPLSEEILREAVNAKREAGSELGGAKLLGISRSTIRHRLREAARRGIAPGHFENGTAPGYLMGKVTVQRGPTGEVERTWERQSPGAEVIQHPTLAARDAYAARGGWWSERRIQAITYHKAHGEVSTATVTPEMLA